jgi:hypothetical protein
VVCIDSEGYAAALALGDRQAEKRGLIRVIDETREDDLYPKRFFLSITPLQAVKKAVVVAA